MTVCAIHLVLGFISAAPSVDCLTTFLIHRLLSLPGRFLGLAVSDRSSHQSILFCLPPNALFPPTCSNALSSSSSSSFTFFFLLLPHLLFFFVIMIIIITIIIIIIISKRHTLYTCKAQCYSYNLHKPKQGKKKEDTHTRTHARTHARTHTHSVVYCTSCSDGTPHNITT